MKINFLPWLFFRLCPASVYQTNGVSRALINQISGDPEKMKLLRALASTSLLPVLRRDGIKNDWQQAIQMPAYPLARINVPTLVVHAVNDPVVNFEFRRFSAAQIPGARCNVSHPIHIRRMLRLQIPGKGCGAVKDKTAVLRRLVQGIDIQ